MENEDVKNQADIEGARGSAWQNQKSHCKSGCNTSLRTKISTEDTESGPEIAERLFSSLCF